MIWSVITLNSDKNEGVSFRLHAPLLPNRFFYLFYDFVHIFTMILEGHFLSLFAMFLNPGANAPRAPYFCLFLWKETHSPSPVHLAGGWWLVGGGWLAGGWLAGCWLLGMDHWFRYIDMYIYIYIYTYIERDVLHIHTYLICVGAHIYVYIMRYMYMGYIPVHRTPHPYSAWDNNNRPPWTWGIQHDRFS